MFALDTFISDFSLTFKSLTPTAPWDITQNLPAILTELMLQLGPEYEIRDGVAIHKTATVEQSAVLKAPVIIGEKCFVGANAYLRGGVYLTKAVTIGTSCEIKTSIIFPNSAVAHFNFIGDSIIGHRVNFEAGSITANHHNDRLDKKIKVCYESRLWETNVEKFGALVGDDSKIGANAVLSPGTLLLPRTIVKRLELVEQVK